MKVAPTSAHHEDGQWGCATPIRSKGQQAGNKGDSHFMPDGQPHCRLAYLQPFHIPDLEQYQTPHERPGDTRGIEEQVVEGIEARHVEVAECKMADHSQYHQATQVTPEVVGMVIALSHEEDHHRSRQSTYDVQKYL